MHSYPNCFRKLQQNSSSAVQRSTVVKAFADTTNDSGPFVSCALLIVLRWFSRSNLDTPECILVAGKSPSSPHCTCLLPLIALWGWQQMAHPKNWWRKRSFSDSVHFTAFCNDCTCNWLFINSDGRILFSHQQNKKSFNLCLIPWIKLNIGLFLHKFKMTEETTSCTLESKWWARTLCCSNSQLGANQCNAFT